MHPVDTSTFWNSPNNFKVADCNEPKSCPDKTTTLQCMWLLFFGETTFKSLMHGGKRVQKSLEFGPKATYSPLDPRDVNCRNMHLPSDICTTTGSGCFRPRFPSGSVLQCPASLRPIVEWCHQMESHRRCCPDPCQFPGSAPKSCHIQ